MKNLKLILALCIFAIIAIVACSQEDINNSDGLQEKTEKVQSAQRHSEEEITPEIFTKSVAIVKVAHAVSIPATTNQDEVALVIKILNFDNNYVLNEAYMIDNIEYSDNGLFNDKIANDGIYTSVQTFISSVDNQNAPEEEDFANVKVSADVDEFLYMDELKTSLAKIKPKIKAEIGCKIVTKPCPQTHWYNTCAFGESSCTCVYLKDCELSIGIEIGF